MELIRWNPRNNLFNLPSRFGALWDDFFAPSRHMTDNEGLWGWNPAVDVFENDDAIVLKAELPGVEKDKICVDVNGRVLTLKGERVSDNEVKQDNYYRRERTQGHFQRSFALPSEIDPDTIKASFKDGVLKVEMPKPEAVKPKQIPVNS
ncbi:MAG: Hsp20/alpha crystallin family protein [Desulfatitalea sp.]|nr:Hsp20/alpha crystallin family protein [Desulfatitalea sp.]NNK01606.1 Hsp20/alpha crystallin family protein [Desulfatitalea sp.]